MTTISTTEQISLAIGSSNLKCLSLTGLLSLSLSLLKGREGDGFPVFQEKFVRECVRKFPYSDATLLQQLVRSIAPVEIVSPPSRFLLAQSGLVRGDAPH